MIFFILAALVLILSVFTLMLNWSKLWARIAYAVTMLLICLMLIVFGLPHKINVKQEAASRRVIVAAVDVSASTGLRVKDFTAIADTAWSNYSLEIIPFSNEVRGPEGAESTGLISSLKSILAYISGKYNDNNIAGFAVITDGNETMKIEELNAVFSIKGKFPHNVVYLTSEKNPAGSGFDKSVSFISVPRFIPRYSKEIISFAVSVTGAKLEGVPVELKLNGKNIGTTFVRLNNGYGEGKFELIVKRAGADLLEASVPIDTRETVTENNKDFALIEGIHKGFRVLHISGHPSADTAFIRRGLQNIPGVDMISFYILRTNKQVYKATDSELSLIPFPTDQLFKDELDNFDLIIINDFRLSEFLNTYYINNIVKFTESGGGLLIIGGPQSFIRENNSVNKFESILPVYTAEENNYDNKDYKIKQNNISRLTPLKDLEPINNLKFKGLNKVKLKEWADVFYSTENNLPVIAGGMKGKVRVLAVLTDSFWRFSYNVGLSNETALKSLIRYVLGIPTMPVKIHDDNISFEDKFKSVNLEDVYAKIKFLNYDGSIQKEETISPLKPYYLQNSDSRFLNILLEKKGRLIDKYHLMNHHEKKWHEHSYLPMGKRYLEDFAKNGSGDFILSKKNNILLVLQKLALKEPVVLSDEKEIESPIYKNKAILILFLYLVISSFYLRSRYSG